VSAWAHRRRVPTGRSARAAAPSPVTASWRLRRWLQVRSDLVLAPLAGAAALGALAQSHRPHTAALALAAIAMGVARARRLGPHAALLPFMRHIQPIVGPALGLAALALVQLATGVPPSGLVGMSLALAASTLVCAWSSTLRLAVPTSRRAAYIGTEAGAARLAGALEAGGSRRYVLVGRIACAADAASANGRPAPCVLGALDDLAAIVVEHDVDVLIMGAEAPRLAVFGQMADSCLDLPVRLAELSVLFEEIFGHVPMAAINPAWFQCVADPDIRSPTGPLKRAIDVAAGSLLLVICAPLLLTLALLVRRDGGPGLFRQVRIGEGGRPFCLYKLRTMQVGADVSAQWASPDDPRVTRVGAFLRRTHLDELPQLVNVLRGEMSLVGPRPEQPELVDRLERMLRFYQRRHLTRPGVTGWAQVRCGYAGSDMGSAWKLCHDLYYLKHRSVALDLLILGETLATLSLRHREEILRPESVAYVLGERG
jgi:exopolysaccharide biosynthesis polyprenyl glycosylphosphotransferase